MAKPSLLDIAEGRATYNPTPQKTAASPLDDIAEGRVSAQPPKVSLMDIAEGKATVPDPQQPKKSFATAKSYGTGDFRNAESRIMSEAAKCPPGIDCSQFSQSVMKGLGAKVPRTAVQQFRASQRVGQNDLQPGDLVFFDNNSRDSYNTNGKKVDGGYVNHVGVYLGNGKFTHDPGKSSDKRSVQDLNQYLKRTGFKFMGGGRVASGVMGAITQAAQIAAAQPPKGKAQVGKINLPMTGADVLGQFNTPQARTEAAARAQAQQESEMSAMGALTTQRLLQGQPKRNQAQYIRPMTTAEEQNFNAPGNEDEKLIRDIMARNPKVSRKQAELTVAKTKGTGAAAIHGANEAMSELSKGLSFLGPVAPFASAVATIPVQIGAHVTRLLDPEASASDKFESVGAMILNTSPEILAAAGLSAVAKGGKKALDAFMRSNPKKLILALDKLELPPQVVAEAKKVVAKPGATAVKSVAKDAPVEKGVKNAAHEEFKRIKKISDDSFERGGPEGIETFLSITNDNNRAASAYHRTLKPSPGEPVEILIGKAREYDNADDFIRHYLDNPQEIPVSNDYVQYLIKEADLDDEMAELGAKRNAIKEKYSKIKSERELTPELRSQLDADNKEYVALGKAIDKLRTKIGKTPDGAVKLPSHIGDKGVANVLGDIWKEAHGVSGSKPFLPKLSPRPKSPVEPPKSPAAPKPEPEGMPKATGLANQVQEREAIQGIIDQVEPTKGKSAEHWQSVGKQNVDEGADPMALARRIGNADEELTGEKVGILLEGKRILQNRLNNAQPGEEYNKALVDLDQFLDDVQKGKGRWSDVGRSLQAGTELDTANFAQVIERVKKQGVQVNPKMEAQFKDLTSKVADQDRRILELERQVKEANAKKAVDRANRGPKMTKEELDTEFSEILSQFAKKAGKVSAGGLDPELLPLLGKAAINRAKRLGLTLEEVLEHVAKSFGVGRDDVLDGIDAVESTNVKKAQEGIDKYRKKLDDQDFTPPTKQERVVSKRLADMRAERDLLSSKVQSAIRSHAMPLGRKFAKGVAGTIRGTILGSDIGVLTRQGLFGISRPVSFAKGVGRGVKSAFSEKALVQIERHIRDHRITDVNGNSRMAGVEYRRAGLSITDHLNHPEELVIGSIFKKVPGLKIFAGAGERFQAAFINTLRTDMMDRAIKLGYKENELKARANFINSVTGRANMKGEPAEWLQVVMTSPRYEKSRWETIGQILRNPAIIAKDLATKKGLNRGAVANLQDMVVTATEIYGLYKLAELSGYEVDFEPTSADFLKMRKGDEVWDPSAGIAPRMRDAVRAVVWTLKPDPYHNVGKALQGAATRTISPAIKTPTEAVSQKAQRALGTKEDKLVSVFSGFEVDQDEKGWQTFTPLVFQTVKKYLDQGDVPGAVSAGAREFVGQSVNRYPKPKK